MGPQAPWHYVDGGCDHACSLPDEEARPMPVETLRQQGIHPHPGPGWNRITSILDDECWQQWGWPQPEDVDTVADGEVSTVVPQAPPSIHPGGWSQELGMSDDTEEPAESGADDGFSDWYGYPSAQDHLCRGRREAVLGTAWIDEAAYLGSPRSLIQIALSSHEAWSKDDPSSKKLHRWQLQEGLSGTIEQNLWEDELHSTWTDELFTAEPAQ